ncbi:LysR family transcriptional regulator [Jiella mangrovi]|uniref:LysR family transcriptional regulator n=1 Tax=Jiella mangrovi TaxID=2821407 RepID=A0ABS4BLY5_9HYPH|nr:LysR family transcriptional regulator [Jiella mangrovi]MBP0617745.1 LysR family transcriptional regulator [Jiella mangrovi]
MRKRVPLNSVRAFEAAARNASVSKAADELCVTPTAVSHQIRQLEDFLQVRLFVRRNNRIDLTPEARANLLRISQALDLIDTAMVELGGSQEDLRSQLSVAASTSVTSLWLMPKLNEYMAREPEVDFSVRSFLTRKEAETQDTDLKICNWRCEMDCQVEPLLEEETIPVASPALKARFGGDDRALLSQATLVHVDRAYDVQEGAEPDWPRYLGEFGIARPDVKHGPRFNQSGTAIDAAKAGVGIILGRSLLIEEARRRGELVAISEPYPVRSRYYLLSPWRTEGRTALQSFKDWLIETVRHNDHVHVV